MAEPADVQAHWTRPGVLARIDAALTDLGHDPQNLADSSWQNICPAVGRDKEVSHIAGQHL